MRLLHRWVQGKQDAQRTPTLCITQQQASKHTLTPQGRKRVRTVPKSSWRPCAMHVAMAPWDGHVQGLDV